MESFLYSNGERSIVDDVWIEIFVFCIVERDDGKKIGGNICDGG